MKEKTKGIDIRSLFSKYGILVMLLVLILIMTILIPGFISVSNVTGILTQSAIYGIMALGVTFIIISGGIDLSAGSMVALVATISAGVGQVAGVNKLFSFLPEMGLWAPLLTAIVIGAVAGAVNGLLIAKLHLLPFIATLGTFTIARGFALVIAQGKAVSGLIPSFAAVGGKIGIIPIPVLIFVICIVICSVLLNKTKFGSNTYAIGGNASAARITGINIQKNIIAIYAFAGIMYGIAAFVFAGRVQSVNAGAAKNYEMTAISASIIGGTNPAGGKGTIWGVVVGTMIITVIRYGLTLLAVDAYWQQIAEGAIIVIAVILAVRKKKA